MSRHAFRSLSSSWLKPCQSKDKFCQSDDRNSPASRSASRSSSARFSCRTCAAVKVRLSLTRRPVAERRAWVTETKRKEEVAVFLFPRRSAKVGVLPRAMDLKAGGCESESRWSHLTRSFIHTHHPHTPTSAFFKVGLYSLCSGYAPAGFSP
jgi:hypothetical protein